MSDMKKKLPEFKNEDAERKFWATADSTEYVDWQSGKRKKLLLLKPSLKTISLRLPVSMIADLKVLANRRDVKYFWRSDSRASGNHDRASLLIWAADARGWVNRMKRIWPLMNVNEHESGEKSRSMFPTAATTAA
jgi:CopG antitoxin of type II toxin-antitoxin system